MNFTIETERLLLTVPDTSDADMILRFISDNAEIFSKYEYRYPDKYFTLDFQKMMITAARQQFVKLQGFRYYIREKGIETRIIGCVGLANVKAGEDKTAEIYYKLDKDFTGRGYATEACRAMLAEAAGTIGLHRVECDILMSNAASIKVAERLGFDFEGVARSSHRVQGQWADHNRYALILEDKKD